MNKQKGFTLIELLVVIAIIGLLATLTVASLNSARAKSRDARRLSDIKSIQTALELFYNDSVQYPGQGAFGPGACLESDQNVWVAAGGCGTTGGETVYLSSAPADPTNNAAAGYVYGYTSASSNTYALSYQLENDTAGVTAGAHSATPAGIQ